MFPRPIRDTTGYYGHTVRGRTPGHTGFHLIRGTSVSRRACPALRRPRCILLSLTAGAARTRRPWLSPWGWPVVTIRPSFAATGRGWRHPTLTCRRPAPWKARRWLKLQGDCCAGYRRAASNGADREAGLKAPDPASPDPHGGLPRAGGLLTAVAQNRRARVPKGSPTGAGNRPLEWLPSRHSRTRRTSRPSPAGLDALHPRQRAPIRIECKVP